MISNTTHEPSAQLPAAFDPRPWLTKTPPDARAITAALATEAPDEATFLTLVRADPAV